MFENGNAIFCVACLQDEIEAQGSSPVRRLVLWHVYSKQCKQAAGARVQREGTSKILSAAPPLAREASVVVSTRVLSLLPHPVRGGRSFAGVPVPAGANSIPIRVVPSARASWRERGAETKRKHAEHFCALQLLWVLQSCKVFFFGPR